jgi:hypothetical protein
MIKDHNLRIARESIKGYRDAEDRALNLLTKLRTSSIANYDSEMNFLKKVILNILKEIKDQSEYFSKRERVKRVETMRRDDTLKEDDVQIDKSFEKRNTTIASIRVPPRQRPFGLIKEFEKSVLELYERDKRKNTEFDSLPLLDYSESTDHNGDNKKPTFDYSINNFCKKMKEIRSKTSRLINLNKKVDEFKKDLPQFFDYQLKKGSFSSSGTKITTHTNNFRVTSRSKMATGSVFEIEEKSAPVGSTTVGTERSTALYSTRSQFMKKNSQPIVDRYIKQSRIMMKSSFWSHGT